VLELRLLLCQSPCQHLLQGIQGRWLRRHLHRALAAGEVGGIVERALLDLDLDLPQQVLAAPKVPCGRRELDPLSAPLAPVVEVYCDAPCGWPDAALPCITPSSYPSRSIRPLPSGALKNTAPSSQSPGLIFELMASTV